MEPILSDSPFSPHLPLSAEVRLGSGSLAESLHLIPSPFWLFYYIHSVLFWGLDVLSFVFSYRPYGARF